MLLMKAIRRESMRSTARRGKLPPGAAVVRTVGLLSALANPLRLRLLLALARFGRLSAGELQQIAAAEQTAVSHQLATLRRHRLVAAERDGRRMIYVLVDDHVAHIVEDALQHANERAQ